MPQYSVRVVNAAGVTIRRTTPKKATQMLKRGIVRLRGNAIELIEDDHRVQPAGCVPRRTFTNGDGFATLDGLKHTPVIQPIRLLIGKRPPSPPRELVVVEVSRQFYVQRF